MRTTHCLGGHPVHPSQTGYEVGRPLLRERLPRITCRVNVRLGIGTQVLHTKTADTMSGIQELFSKVTFLLVAPAPLGGGQQVYTREALLSLNAILPFSP